MIQGFRDDTTGRVLTDPNFIIEHARRYYSQAFKESETSSQNQDAIEFKRTLSERLAELPSQPFLFKIADLHRSIHRLKTKTSSGHEKVSNKLLKSIPLSHCGFLLRTFNDLLIRNAYPEHWKLSKLILLPKDKSSNIALDQTRPISLLPCLGKVYERCFLICLIQWVKMNCILLREQSGFREKHSTATRFVPFLQHISSGLLQQTATLVIYVDFIKAFDQLWHDGLLYKLHQMNCPYELVIFIVEYLKNRKKLHRNESTGFEHFRHRERNPSGILSWADSLSTFSLWTASSWWCRSKFASQMQRFGEKALKQAQSYASEWKQLINFPKTEWQWIHRRVCPPSLDLIVDGNRVKRTSLVKYLGNYVDERFSFDQRCNKMLQKIQNNASLLKYVARSRPSSVKARNLLFLTFIRPYFRMIYAVWSLLSNCSIDFLRTGQTQPTMKYGDFRVSWRRTQRHNVSCASSSTKRSQHLQNCLMTTSSVKPCQCTCSSMLQDRLSSMPSLVVDSTNMYMIGWNRWVTKNDNVTWIDYHHCSKRECRE